MELFNVTYTRNSHIRMGLFYELWTKCLFGGKLADQRLLKDYENSNSNEQFSINPDIENDSSKMLYESKADRNGHHLNLLDDQINKYKRYQSLYRNYKIYFVIWRHSFKNIKSYHGTTFELFTALCNKTTHVIAIPFDVILAIHTCKHLKRRELDNWYHCTIILSTFINMPTNGKQDEFFEILELNKNDFDVISYEVPSIEIQECKTKITPLTFIKSLKYNEWREKFINEFVPF